MASQPATKRPKIEAVAGGHSASPAADAANAAGSPTTSNPSLLSEDALLQVMTMLGPRELHRMAFTCNALRDAVTTPMVVKSAMIRGGSGARECMKAVHDLMSEGHIHVPSPLRLLRLVNGKRCEFCNVTQLFHSASTWRLGVFACRSCLEDRMVMSSDPLGSRQWRTGWSEDVYFEKLLPHPRVPQWYDKVQGSRSTTRVHMWKSKTVSAGFGEPIGPVISFQQLTPFLGEAKGVVTSEMVDEYFASELKVPPAADYDEFVQVYKEIKARSDRIVAERKEKKQATAQKNKSSREAKVKKMIGDLKAMLDEGFRDVALTATEGSGRACVHFTSPFVEKLLNPYVCSPSKVRKKILVELAANINEKFRLIEGKGFINMNFCSGDDPFEAAVKKCFGDKYSSYGGIIEISRYRGVIETKALDEAFFRFLESDQPIRALAYFEQKNFYQLLLPEDEEVKAEPKLKSLAENVWQTTLAECVGGGDDRFARVYSAASTTFADARLAIDEYTRWLEERHPDNESRRKDARKQALGYKYLLPRILNKDFQSLDDGYESDFSLHLFSHDSDRE